MKLKCNVCLISKGVAKKTNELWLVNWKGRDYLVCSNHLPDNLTVDHKRKEKNNDIQ